MATVSTLLVILESIDHNCHIWPKHYFIPVFDGYQNGRVWIKRENSIGHRDRFLGIASWSENLLMAKSEDQRNKKLVMGFSRVQDLARGNRGPMTEVGSLFSNVLRKGSFRTQACNQALWFLGRRQGRSMEQDVRPIFHLILFGSTINSKVRFWHQRVCYLGTLRQYPSRGHIGWFVRVRGLHGTVTWPATRI